AKTRQVQAQEQIMLLERGDSSGNTDFFSYRYLATEGFLPGYNFPRLPVYAFIQPLALAGARKPVPGLFDPGMAHASSRHERGDPRRDRLELLGLSFAPGDDAGRTKPRPGRTGRPSPARPDPRE